MADQNTPVHAEDMFSVGTRISWGAIVAGAVLALALHFLLGTLGSAVGLSLRDRVDTENLHIGVIAWAILTMAVSLFVGGLVTTQFTVGENKMEAVLYGIIMWALLVAMLFTVGAAGTSAGLHALATQRGSQGEGARTASLQAQIDALRQRDATDKAGTQTTSEQKTARDDAAKLSTELSWYAFAGTWISMLAAAAGAFVGAGPTFRLAVVRGPNRVTS